MKRNRLLSSSPRTRLFASKKLGQGKKRHLILLSILSIIGISITSIVLATSEPALSTKSTIVDLPNLPAEMQNLPAQNQASKTETKQAKTITNLKPTNTNAETAQQEAEQKELSTIKADRNQVELIQMEKMHPQQNTVAAVPQQSQESTSPTNPAPSAQVNVPPAPAVALTWETIKVKSGDNLSLIFSRAGLDAQDVYNVAQSGEGVKPLLNLMPGQFLKLGIDDSNHKDKQLKQIRLQLSPVKTFEADVKADGSFTTKITERETDKKQLVATGDIENSLFADGQKAGLPDKMIMQLAHIFGWDIDFALDLRKGDTFKVIYQQEYLDGKEVNDGEILAAEFTNQGKTYRAIRYTLPDGDSEYYAPNGDSMRKEFLRTPVNFTRISSRFTLARWHPILHRMRAHKGVDYAAPIGTPVKAAGDGKVIFAGRQHGYGNVIILKHGEKYSTLYGHLHGFARGIHRGIRVRQGQIIGYVGMSGLATGPHLHYEFRINGVHHNPLTVALPKAAPISKKYYAAFEQKAQPLLARLDQSKTPATVALNP